MVLSCGSELIRLHNQRRQSERPNWTSLGFHLEAARAYLAELKGRIMFRSDSLRALKTASAELQNFQNRCTLLSRLLDSLASIIGQREQSKLDDLFGELGPAIDSLDFVVKSLQEVASELPVFSDLPGLNEIFTIGLNLLNGDPLEESGLKARLPALYKWVQSLDGLSLELESSYPEESELAQHFKNGLNDLQQALGGLVLFFEDGNKNDLSLSLSLLDRGVRNLAPALTVLRALQRERAVYSQDPILEILHSAASQWASGVDNKVEVQLALNALVQAHAIDLELTRRRTFLPYGHYQDIEARLEECQANLSEILAGLQQETEAQVFLESLSDFRDFAQELDAIDQQLKAFEKPKLNNSPIFKEFFETMEGVYLEEVRDEVLADQLHLIKSANQKFLRALEYMTHKSEEDLIVEECLKEQAMSIEELERYLSWGDRMSLLRAYETMLPASLDLEELDQCYKPEDTSGPLDLMDSDSTLLQSRSFRQVLAIVEAHRTGSVRPEDGAESLRTLIENAEMASRELSSRVRPMAYNQDDLDAQAYFEQLNVILNYQLDGLHRLDEALATQSTHAIKEALDELAEVDAYLLEFQETQEKLVGARPV